MQHGEFRRSSEDGHQLFEMLTTEALLGFGADEQHAPVAFEEARGDEEIENRLCLIERFDPVPPVRPHAIADPPLLQGESQELLSDDVTGARWRLYRLHIAGPPEPQKPCRHQKIVMIEREEQTVARGVRATACAPETLQERGDRPWRVDLDDTVQVTDVHAQFESRGGDDDAVTRLLERLFGSMSFLCREGGVREERGHPVRAKQSAQFLDHAPGVAEHQPFLAAMERRYELGRVGDRSHVI